MKYSTDEIKLKSLRKVNNWLGILQLYKTDFTKDLSQDLLIDDKCEILFAASHYADNLQEQVHDKETVENMMDIRIWIYKNSYRLLHEVPKHLIVLKNYAYIQYDLQLNLNVLKKLCRKYAADDKYQKVLADWSVSYYGQGLWCFTKALQKNPADIKSIYRLMHLIYKEKDMYSYKWKKDDWEECKKAHKQILYLYNQLVSEYKKQGCPKNMRKEYIRANFQAANEICDECLNTVDFEYNLPKLRKKTKISIQTNYDVQTNYRNISWTLDDLKSANHMLYITRTEMDLPKNITEDNIRSAAGMENPAILPFYVYYRQAKIYYMIFLCYMSGIWQIYRMRQSDPSTAEGKAKYFWNLALQNCRYALEVRAKRKSLGFTDSNGMVHEAGFLLQIHLSNPDSDESDLEEIYKNFSRDTGVQYYRILNEYIKAPERKRDDAIDALNLLATRQIRPVQRKLNRTVSRIKNGEL